MSQHGSSRLMICLRLTHWGRDKMAATFPDDIFKCIFLNENEGISIKISLKFVPKGQINNIPSLVQIMAWRRPGDKPLSEAMMVSLSTHICVTRPQWVNAYPTLGQLQPSWRRWPMDGFREFQRNMIRVVTMCSNNNKCLWRKSTHCSLCKWSVMLSLAFSLLLTRTSCWTNSPV